MEGSLDLTQELIVKGTFAILHHNDLKVINAEIIAS
jgi:hypothetical protein